MVFMHLSEPEEALRCLVEMVEPGGLIATRDRGSSFHIEGPYAEELARVVQIVADTTNAVSGSRFGHSIGQVMHRLCREAGLQLLQLTADLEIQPAASRSFVLAGPSGQRAIQCGLTTQEELDQLARYWEVWMADPDAYLALDHYEVVARKPFTVSQ
jgi:hypothetical protein